MESDESSNTPKYFSLLSEADKDEYRILQSLLLHATEKRHRGHRLDIFLDCLRQVRQFCHRGDDNDWKRCCVCGVCFLKCGIALNSHQMKYLTNKCKSSINGALKMMKYKTTSARGDINPELVDFLKILKGNTNELRQWSVRTPDNYLPPTNDSISQINDKSNTNQYDISTSPNINLNKNASNSTENETNSISVSEEEEITEASDIINSYQNNANVNCISCITTKTNGEETENATFKSASVLITDGDVHIIGTDKYYTNFAPNASMNISDSVKLPTFIGNDLNSKAAISLDDFDIVPSSQCIDEINNNIELIEISCLSAQKPKDLFEDGFTDLMF